MKDSCHQLEATDGAARAGWLTASDGTPLATPLFQPVATGGSLKTLDWNDVSRLGYGHVLMNTYHLVVRPGLELIREAGGIKAFTGWPGSVLTDSGGYQAYSLAQRRKVDAEGITFQDHIAGDMHRFTPRSVLEAQLAFGVDFAMCLDVCTGQDELASRERTARDMELTHAWAREQADLWPTLLGAHGFAPATQAVAEVEPARAHMRAPLPRLFGIVQGGLLVNLRAESIETIAGLNFDGIALGGLAVGEPREDLQRLISFCGPRLPADRPRYLMGIGDPADLLFAIAHGFDMFDCVQPTRMARHGVAFTWHGKLPLRQERFKQDFRPLSPVGAAHGRPVSNVTREEGRPWAAPTRAYLRHLFTLKEHSFARLLTLHNLAFYAELIAEARQRIVEGTYNAWWPGAFDAVDRLLPDGL